MKKLLLILTLLFGAFSPKNLFAPMLGSDAFIENERRGACGYCGSTEHVSEKHQCQKCKLIGLHNDEDCLIMRAREALHNARSQATPPTDPIPPVNEASLAAARVSYPASRQKKPVAQSWCSVQ